MHRSARALSFCTALTALACGGGDDGDTALEVAWTFAAGDCAANGVDTVRVTWGPEGGPTQDIEFPCADGSGTLGSVAAGSYAIDAEGLDAAGLAVAESFGASTSFSGAVPGGVSVDITLHPRGVDLLVSWSFAAGGGCPQGVVLPYFVTLYQAPTAPGGEPTEVVDDTQESCSSGQVTFTNVRPGDYVVEVDSRAQSPAVKATAPVTITPGQDAQVAVSL